MSRSAKHVRSVLIGGILLLALCATGWTASEKVLYAFHGNDGWGPTGVILGPDGALYGATVTGGTNSCDGNSYGLCGVVFQLAVGTDGKWHETVLHNFEGSDGQSPNGALVADKAGNLYGTTVDGGPSCSQLGCGVVFELVRGTAGKWTFKVLHDFALDDGANPYAGMIFDSKGNLYGTTSIGGNTSTCNPPEGCGVIFKMTEAKGVWTETVLYSFSGSDGAEPSGPLVFDSAGDLYGTTEYGGAHGSGTVFKLAPQGQGWTETVLHSFSFDTRDGDSPAHSMTFDHSGNLYGATPFGGTEGMQGWGTAFKLTPTGGGKWKETILHRFNRAEFNGGYVSSGLVLGKSGDLYGTTNWGGKYDCALGGGLGCGVVFKLTLQAGGKWTESVLHSFGHGNDGAFPSGGLVFNSSGDLFGVADGGGYTGYPCGTDGCGVVFEVTP